ncbi:MAG: hypothetical protein ABMB14_18400 [Myxococcota bacterium]
MSGWPEDARADLEERIAILAADGVPEPERIAEELVRAEILRACPEGDAAEPVEAK